MQPSDDVERVRRATDLVELIESFAPLRRAGTSFRALCPFHEERTPSFHVFPQSQLFKCFGCNATGDAFSFIQKRHNVGFREALEWLAERAGIELTRARREGPAGPGRKTVFECLEQACRHFEWLLTKKPAIASHLDTRGIPAPLRSHWRIGVAPDGWTTLHERLLQLGFPVDVQLAAGVVATSESGRVYDRFRNRITFPITDVLGRVIAFGARLFPGVAEGEANGPKYLNSPEGELFTKRSVLYGLDKIAKAPRHPDGASDPGPIVIMEGYTDVILAHAAGMDRAVATLGTSLGRDHAKLIKRYAGDVLLLYDGDEAGLRATERGVGILIEEGLDARVAALPDDLDPADFILERGGPEFLKQVGQGVGIFDFLGDRALQRIGRERNTRERLVAADEMLQLIARMDSVTARSEYTRKIAYDFGLLETVVDDRLATLVEQHQQNRLQRRTTAGPGSDRGTDPGSNNNDPGNLLPSAAARLGAAVSPPQTVRADGGEPAGHPADSRSLHAAEELLGGLLRDPSLLALVRAAGFDPAVLPHPGFQCVLRAALVAADAGIEPDHHVVALKLVDTAWRDLPAALYGAAPASPEAAVTNALAYFKKLQIGRSVDDIKRRLAVAERAGDLESAKLLQVELLQMLRAGRPALQRSASRAPEEQAQVPPSKPPSVALPNASLKGAIGFETRTAASELDRHSPEDFDMAGGYEH